MHTRIRAALALVALVACVAATAHTALAAPDLTPEIFDVSIFVSDLDPGDVGEGCAGGTSQRTLLRFGLRTRNLGPDDLVLGAPGCPDCRFNPGVTCANPLFFCSPAHHHVHFRSFVRPEVVDASGNVLARGYKLGFCLEDTDCAAPKFTCEFQGITAGCSDVYPAGISCQYVDLTDAVLPPGTYTLRVTIDPENAIVEADEGNNIAEVPVQLGAPPPVCPVHIARDVPRAIPDAGAVSSTVDVPLTGALSSVKVVGLRGTHASMSDLELHLTSPSGTDVVIMDRVCGTDDDFALDLDDAACDAIACPPTDRTAHVPSNALAAFVGENAAGTWTLTAFDRVAGDTGSLDGWGLEICVAGAGCPIYRATAGSVTIPEIGVATSTLTSPSRRITDVNVVGLHGTHTFMSDLEFHLTSPAGTDVVLMNRECGIDHDFRLDLDDSACRSISCPPTDGLVHQPREALSAFVGEDAGGPWTLRVFDRAEGDSGTLDGWGLQICSCGNGTLDPGEQCDDGNVRSGDCCSATCDVGVDCPACEACDAASATCVEAPRRGCRLPATHGKSMLSMIDRAPDARDALTWKWIAGAPTTGADFGNPAQSDDYSLCVFDKSAVIPGLLLRADAPAGGACVSLPCWKALGNPPGSSGFKYTSRGTSALRSVALKPGGAGKSRAIVKGAGAALGMPALPLSLPLAAQLQNVNGQCWETNFENGGVITNSSDRFKARAE